MCGSMFGGFAGYSVFGVFGVLLAFIFTLGIPTAYTFYVLYWKDYSDKTYEVKETIKIFFFFFSKNQMAVIRTMKNRPG
jgi:phosphate starvation-inducible membrane PsiE